MLMTNYEIYSNTQNLIEAFKDSTQYLPVKINFFIQKNKSVLLKLAQDIEEARINILRNYGTINEDGNINIPTNHIEIVNKELKDLFNITQEVELRTFSIDIIPEDISLTTGQMDAIMFMID